MLWRTIPLESAEKAYNEGKFAEASAIYGKISQEHGVSASLLANMGNAYAKAGEITDKHFCVMNESLS